jgi:hypothetical protein
LFDVQKIKIKKNKKIKIKTVEGALNRSGEIC